jgi:hypothetical protein
MHAFLRRLALQTADSIEEVWGLLLFVLSLAGGIQVLHYFGNPNVAGTQVPWEWILQIGELGILILLFIRIGVGYIKAVVKKMEAGLNVCPR